MLFKVYKINYVNQYKVHGKTKKISFIEQDEKI